MKEWECGERWRNGIPDFWLRSVSFFIIMDVRLLMEAYGIVEKNKKA